MQNNIVKVKKITRLVVVLAYVVAIASISMYISFYSKYNYGDISKSRWLMLDWINKNVDRGSIIMSSNIGDTYLISYYTKANPFVPTYSTSSLSMSEIMSRYFYSLWYLHKLKAYYQRIKNYQYHDFYENYVHVSKKKTPVLNYDVYQTQAFYSTIIDYPVNKLAGDILLNTKARRRFIDLSNHLIASLPMKKYQFDYIILDKKHDPKPEFFSKAFHIVYKNGRYVILKENVMPHSQD